MYQHARTRNPIPGHARTIPGLRSPWNPIKEESSAPPRPQGFLNLYPVPTGPKKYNYTKGAGFEEAHKQKERDLKKHRGDGSGTQGGLYYLEQRATQQPN